MAIYVAKDTGLPTSARQPASQDGAHFEVWIRSLGYNYEEVAANIKPYDWFIPIDSENYRILSDDDFDELYEEAPTTGQGG